MAYKSLDQLAAAGLPAPTDIFGVQQRLAAWSSAAEADPCRAAIVVDVERRFRVEHRHPEWRR